MANKTNREKVYIDQLKALGIYDPAFDPEIKTLATLEREWTSAKKEWSSTAKDGGKPSFADPLYAVIQSLRKEILAHREALGLTPKALRKLRGTPEPVEQEDLIASKLSAIAQRVGAYELPVFDSDTEGGGLPQTQRGLEMADGVFVNE